MWWRYIVFVLAQKLFYIFISIAGVFFFTSMTFYFVLFSTVHFFCSGFASDCSTKKVDPFANRAYCKLIKKKKYSMFQIFFTWFEKRVIIVFIDAISIYSKRLQIITTMKYWVIFSFHSQTLFTVDMLKFINCYFVIFASKINFILPVASLWKSDIWPTIPFSPITATVIS